MAAACARSARHWLAASVLTTLTVTAAGVHADEPFDLTWHAPADCPQAPAVREQVRALAPRAMLERGQLRAEGTITRVDARFRLRLVMQLGDITGERSIESSSCGDLAGAAAVALGLLLKSADQSDGEGAGTPETSDASGVGGASQPHAPRSSEQSTEQPPRAPDAPPSDEEDQRSRAHARAARVFVHAPQLSADIGPLPRPSLALAAGAGVRVQGWELLADVRVPTKQRVDFADSLAAELDHFALSLDTCRAFTAPPLELAPCLTFGLEHVSARGTGAVEAPRSADTTWLSIGARAWGRWYMTRWLALAVGVGGRLEAARPSVEIDGLPRKQRLKPAALTLRAGPMLVF